jgi:type II secretory pathway pseudopilin PulG
MQLRSATLALLLIGTALTSLAQENENRATATLERMNTIATAIMAYMTDANAAPAATSVEALRAVLSPTYIKELPTSDGWDTPFRYVKTGNASFQIISAGSDSKFDEKSWNVPVRTTDLTADAVYAKTKPDASGRFERVWVGAGGAALALTTEEGAVQAKPFVDRFTEKTKDMSEEKARTYLHTSGTRRTMFALGAYLEAYKRKKGSYPPGRSMKDVQQALFPEFTSDVEKTDWWGTELRYIAAPDGKSYTLVSAGSDRTFDESSWDQRGPLASADDDAVLRDGVFIRMWDEHTRPGETAESKRRKSLKPAAREALQRADTLRATDDYAGALDAYMDAVKADPAAADLESIKRYNAGYDMDQQKVDQSLTREAAALRQYVQLRPGEWEATCALAFLIDLPQAESLLAPFIKTRPADPELYAARGSVRSSHHAYATAAEDFDKAAELDPQNAERQYTIGVVHYEAVAKSADLPDAAKREHIRRGIAALKRAEALKDNYFESMTYRSLLVRQQALLEKDPEVQKKLVAEADAIRDRVLEIIKSRRAGTQKK